MSRRALALVSAVVMSIGVGAWWLSAEVAAPRPIPVVVAPVVSPPSVVIAAPEPTPSPHPVDAGAPTGPVDAGRLAEVEIEVYDDGVRQVGIRVELEGPGGQREGRPIDVMGVARFTLEEGAWRVTSPKQRNVALPRYDEGSRSDWVNEAHLAYSTLFEVRAPLTRLRVDLAPRRIVRGQVLDVKDRPVSSAAIELIREAPRIRDLDFVIGLRGTVAFTDGEGHFEFEADSESVVIQARSGNSRSVPRVVKAPGERTLVLEPWTILRVKVVGPGSAPACVRVTRRGEFVAAGASDSPIEVPEGSVEILAMRSALSRGYSGRAEATLADVEAGEALVRLKPLQPIRGRLVNASGGPVPGVTVSMRAVDPTRAVMIPDGGIVRPASSSVSGPTGEFSLTAATCDDPIWLVTVGGLWRTAHQVLVRLDDAPIEVVIEPTHE